MTGRSNALYEDDAIRSLRSRALTYLKSGIPVHFRGPAGVGKSTLATDVAAHLGRPVLLLIGDRQFTTFDLVGREVGTRSKQVVDRFVHNVQKRETETAAIWGENVLTAAVKKGCTLIYDEFTRSPPTANNALLAALEEGRLVLPGKSSGETIIDAHPDFRVIFTSNPDDYAGVEAPQDALVDRMITLEMGDFDPDTEAGIVSTRTGIAPEKAGVIVRLVRNLRRAGSDQSASLRGAIMIARIVMAEGMVLSVSDPRFVQLCVDVLIANWRPDVGGRIKSNFINYLKQAFAQEGLA